jgi:hypothetical protein
MRTCPLRPGVAQGPQKLWDKWCKILHSRPLLALNFIIETSFYCTIFLIFFQIFLGILRWVPNDALQNYKHFSYTGAPLSNTLWWRRAFLFSQSGMSIDFEVAGENWKVAGKLMRTAQPPSSLPFMARGLGTTQGDSDAGN